MRPWTQHHFSIHFPITSLAEKLDSQGVSMAVHNKKYVSCSKLVGFRTAVEKMQSW